MRLRKGGLVPGAVVALVLMAIASPLQVGARITPSASPAVPASIQRGFINLDGSPGTPAVNPRTDTLYVPVQCPIGCPPAPLTHEMDLINTSTCNSVITTDCHVVARARVGDSPLAAAVDEKTDTIYVANGTGSVSVVNGSTCNATVTSGCSTPVATIDTGGFPVDDVFNPMTSNALRREPCSGQRLRDRRRQLQRPDDERVRKTSEDGDRHLRSSSPGRRCRDRHDLHRRQRFRKWKHRVRDRRRHLQREHRQRLRIGAAQRHRWQWLLLGCRRSGDQYHLRREQQRQHGLGHQWRSVQRRDNGRMQ